MVAGTADSGGMLPTKQAVPANPAHTLTTPFCHRVQDPVTGLGWACWVRSATVRSGGGTRRPGAAGHGTQSTPAGVAPRAVGKPAGMGMGLVVVLVVTGLLTLLPLRLPG
jgi:hypothetical protein